MATPFKGTVKSFDPSKGFGFIDAEDGKSIFFHKNAVRGAQPSPGAAAQGEWEDGDKGPRAVKVMLAAAPAASGGVAAAPKSYYSDSAKKQIRPELLCEEARATAERLAGERLNSSQLRRFFEEVRTLEKVVKTRGFDVAKPLVRMLAAKAHYAKGRDKIGQTFMDYLSANAKAIQDEKDFDAFMKGFEAVVGYFYFLNPKRG